MLCFDASRLARNGRELRELSDARTRGATFRICLSDRQHAFVEVNVAALKPDRLGKAHARHRDQAEQVVGPTPQPGCGRQGQRRRQQHPDLCIAVNIGPGALQARQDPGRRHFRLRIDVRDVAREGASIRMRVAG